MEALLVALILVAVIGAVIVFVAAPLRAGRAEQGEGEDPRIADLEARKEAKYREIRDTELDHAAGKLSEADFRRQDAELRREAIQILRELDQVRGK